MSTEQQKQAAAVYAAGLVRDGMAVGLGSGTTSALVVTELGRRVREGLRLKGVPTSDDTAHLAASLGIPLATLEEQSRLDIVIDGADEVDPSLNLIKGRGGALLREKLVALSGNRFVVVADESKRVQHLGSHAPVPVEVVPFGWITTRGRLERLGLTCELRGGEDPYLTDEGNYILDCHGGSSVEYSDPSIAAAIKAQTGVVEHGLFLGIASMVVVGVGDGDVDVLDRGAPRPES
jgi:ribose 5-phosphate isomerase A